MLTDFLVGASASALVGVVLWVVLPRGVVLTQAPKVRDHGGDALYDTWTIRNESALPVVIQSVRIRGVGTFDDASGRPNEVPLTIGNQDDHGVSLRLDDTVAEIGREEVGGGWVDVVVAPGDSLTAHVPNNTNMEVTYRRAGRLGRVEQRALVIRGGL